MLLTSEQTAMRKTVYFGAAMLAATAAYSESFGRFGVALDVPDTFTMEPPPANDDGRSFTDARGGTLRVWGGWPLDGLAADKAQVKGFYQSDGAEITFEAAGQGWYVLSGYLGDMIFYTRVHGLQNGHRGSCRTWANPRCSTR
jgi:hypothetical protein